MQNKKHDLFSNLQTKGVFVDSHQQIKIINRINEMLSYQPKVGVLGKTGAGKSSLCNALFGMDVAPISDVRSCTRDIQNVFVDIGGNKNIILVDVPGVGENKAYDVEYKRLYKTLLPELDILLWVTIAISDEIIDALKRLWKRQERYKLILKDQYIDSNLINCNQNGTIIMPNNLSRDFKRLLKKLELKHIRFHDLRHSAASLMLVSDVPMKVISDILGHSSLSITADLYTHVMDASKLDAANKVTNVIFNKFKEDVSTYNESA